MESQIKTIPWISLILLFLTYCVFGWILSQSNADLTIWVLEQGEALGWELQAEMISVIIQILETVLILTLTIALTTPGALLTFFFGSWLDSDVKGFMSVLIWTFAFVLMVCWLKYFIRLLVILAAVILARLELQLAGYQDWQISTILAVICLTGFGIGLFTFALG
ncbi:MAG: hypothetical protein DSM107014_08860 [Gomphosphaeria aponina SAG 52.96 = DSM 107014]|uniref:Uncharacterized protein n=1 Tax=Gomphosphaeria aponina SAG 52.96 = DSM 107014 TaxID=1521640 RepID=A0A941JV07_9CHRO|nr:hypothetical protein [Gomphosphaeria aponina SAG 52.96 = DSM 107014]